MNTRTRLSASGLLAAMFLASAFAADSCALRPESGMLASLAHAHVVAMATADASAATEDGRTMVGFAIHEILTASVDIEDGALLFAFDPFAGADSGWPLAGRLVLVALERDEFGEWRLIDAAIDLGDEGNAGARELLAALAASDDLALRARTLAQAARTGGARTRLRAALDLESDARLVAALDADSLEDLRLAMNAGASESSLPILAALFALTSAPDAQAVALNALATAQGDATLVALRRMVKSKTLNLTARDLEPLLRADREPALRRRATDLLARVRESWALPRLIELTADADADVASEALVGLAGRAPATINSICRDEIRALLDTSPVSAPVAFARQRSPIERRLETRDLRMMRVEPYSGARLRAMAAGFVLARGDASDRAWLAEQLANLKDANVARFLRAMLAAPFADFQDAW